MSLTPPDAQPPTRSGTRKLRALRNAPLPPAGEDAFTLNQDEHPVRKVQGGAALGMGRRVRFGTPAGAWESGDEAFTAARVSLRRPQVFADSGMVGPFVGSLVAHGLLIGLLLWRPDSLQGSPQASEAPQVEMVFTPAENHSTRQPTVKEQGGGAEAPPPPSPTPESATKSVVPTPTAPAATQAEVSPTGELPDTQSQPRPVTPATPRQTHHARPSPTHRQYAHHQDNNPLAHPQDWSFNAPPVPHARHRGRRGGAGGPIDLSIGPLSLNGQINAPYKTHSSVRGVSSDYGAEVDRWIHQHLFYPEDAAENGEQGPSAVHVAIDRSGRVLRVYTTHGSGYYSIDTALTGMFRGAQLPPVPPDMTGDHFDLDVTVNYILLNR